MSFSPSAYLFYGMITKKFYCEDNFPSWLVERYNLDADLHNIYNLYKIIDEKEEPIREKYGCHLCSSGDDDEPRLILAAGPKVYGIPSEDQKPVAFFVTDGNTPVKIETCHFMGWDDQLNEAADYLGWPKEERDIGWWMTANLK